MTDFDEIRGAFTEVFGEHWDIEYHPTEDKCIIKFTFSRLRDRLDCSFWMADGKVHITDSTSEIYVCDVPPGFEHVFEILSTLKMTDVVTDAVEDLFYDYA